MTSENGVDYSDLTALYVNCTLKKSPELSHTQGLMDRGIALMRAQGAKVDSIRFIDHDIAGAVHPLRRGIDTAISPGVGYLFYEHSDLHHDLRFQCRSSQHASGVCWA